MKKMKTFLLEFFFFWVKVSKTSASRLVLNLLFECVCVCVEDVFLLLLCDLSRK